MHVNFGKYIRAPSYAAGARRRYTIATVPETEVKKAHGVPAVTITAGHGHTLPVQGPVSAPSTYRRSHMRGVQTSELTHPRIQVVLGMIIQALLHRLQSASECDHACDNGPCHSRWRHVAVVGLGSDLKCLSRPCRREKRPDWGIW